MQRRGNVVAAEDLRVRRVPVGLLRPLEEQVAELVRVRLRQQGEDPRLPRTSAGDLWDVARQAPHRSARVVTTFRSRLVPGANGFLNAPKNLASCIGRASQMCTARPITVAASPGSSHASICLAVSASGTSPALKKFT